MRSTRPYHLTLFYPFFPSLSFLKQKKTKKTVSHDKLN